MEWWRRVQRQLREAGRAISSSTMVLASFCGTAVSLTIWGIARLLASPTGDRVGVGLVFVLALAGVAAICLLSGLRRVEGGAPFVFLHRVLYFAAIFEVMWFMNDLGRPWWQVILTSLVAAVTVLAASFLFLYSYGRVPGASEGSSNRP